MIEAEQVCQWWDLAGDERNTYLLGAYILISLSFLIRAALVVGVLYVGGAGVLWATRQYRGAEE